MLSIVKNLLFPLFHPENGDTAYNGLIHLCYRPFKKNNQFQHNARVINIALTERDKRPRQNPADVQRMLCIFWVYPLDRPVWPASTLGVVL